MFSTAALPTVPGHLKETHTKWNLPSLFISITLVPGGFSVKHKRMWWLNNSPRLNVFSAWHWEPLMVAVRLHVKCVTVTLSAYSSRSVSISVFHRVCVRVCACARGSVCVCFAVWYVRRRNGHMHTLFLPIHLLLFRQTDRGSGARLTQLHRFIQEEMQSLLPRVTASGDCQLVNPRHTHTHKARFVNSAARCYTSPFL